MQMLEEHRCYGGWQQRWQHQSATLNCPMTFSLFLPPEGKNAAAGAVLAFWPDLQ